MCPSKICGFGSRIESDKGTGRGQRRIRPQAQAALVAPLLLVTLVCQGLLVTSARGLKHLPAGAVPALRGQARAIRGLSHSTQGPAAAIGGAAIGGLGQAKRDLAQALRGPAQAIQGPVLKAALAPSGKPSAAVATAQQSSNAMVNGAPAKQAPACTSGLYYTVRSGDTCALVLAARFNNSAAAFTTLNGFSCTNPALTNGLRLCVAK